MRNTILLAFLFCILGYGFTQANAQSVQCRKECIRTVRALVKERKYGLSTSWLDKANRALGDSVSVGIQKIFTKKSILASRNIRLFLPLIREAFRDPEMISKPENKTPTVTLKLLDRLRSKVSDSSLKEEISTTIEEIKKSTSGTEPFPYG